MRSEKVLLRLETPADIRMAQQALRDEGGDLYHCVGDAADVFWAEVKGRGTDLAQLLPERLKAYRVRAGRSAEVARGSVVRVLDVPFEQRKDAQSLGAEWDKKRKAWTYVGTGELPRGLAPFSAEPYSWEAWRQAEFNKRWPEPRPRQPGFALRPHQQQAVAAAMTSFEAGRMGFLLADDVGLGKTYAAWEVALRLPVKRILIACPLSVMAAWRDSIQMAGDGGKHIVILNYDRLQRLFEDSDGKAKSRKGLARYATPVVDFDLVILDEAHKLKNHATARAKLIKSLLREAPGRATRKYALWLSATAGQNPSELIYLASLLSQLGRNPQEIRPGRSDEDFLDNYLAWCASLGIKLKRGLYGRIEWEANDRDCELLSDLLFAPVKQGRTNVPPAGIRRRPEDIAGWPAITRILLPVELTPSQRQLYTQEWQAFRKALKLRPQGKAGKGSSNPLVAQLRLRQRMSIIRLDRTFEHACDLLEDGKQVAISVQFSETADELTKRFAAAKIKSTILDGRQTKDGRERERLRFQRGEVQVVIFTVEEGISLHQGQHNDVPRACIIHDLRWSALQMGQIEGRCHRDGKFAQVYWMFGAETVEAKIAQVVAGRVKHMKTIMGDDTETIREIETLLSKLGESEADED